MYFVEMFLGDNKSNQIILLYATWETFIAKRAIEKLMQSIISASLSIRNLVIELVKIRDIVKLTSHDTCMYMKPAIILFLFILEHCVEHVYLWLRQNTHVSNKFKQFIIYLHQNCVICDAANILRKIYDTESTLDNIVNIDALHEK